MLDHKKIIVVSNINLLNANYDNHVNAFSTILSNHGYWFAYGRTALTFLVDYFYYHTIDSYNKGKLTDEEFRAKFSKQLGINITNAAFDDAWNSVYSEIQAGKIQSVCDIIKNKEALLVIINISNKIHHTYINNYLQQFFNIDESNQYTQWINSYEYKELLPNILIKYAISKVDQSGNKIYLLHPSFTTSSDFEVQKAKLMKTPYNPNTARLGLSEVIHNILNGGETGESEYCVDLSTIVSI